MTPYGKVAQAAIAATSLLAEHYAAGGGVRFNSRDIALRRKLSQPVVAKVLTTLSQAGVVTGSPGPGGGYTLARAPSEITLQAIVEPFDRLDDHLVCPFGEGWCGNGPQCPLHAQLSDLRARISAFLRDTTLAAFIPANGA
jgi:Rrf2 family iron-sulfur cluster assembly transcriptional regulator